MQPAWITVPVGIITALIAIYYFYFKVSYKVSAYVSWGRGQFEAPRVRSVTLINHKERPVVIFKIYMLIKDEGFLIKLKDFPDPLILKPLEAISIQTDPISEYMVDGKTFDLLPSSASPKKYKILYSTIGKTRECITAKPQSLNALPYHSKKIVSIRKEYFNDIIIPKSVAYIVIYLTDGSSEQQHALVNANGFISWHYSPNMVSKEILPYPQKIADSLMSTQSLSFITHLSVVGSCYVSDYFSSVNADEYFTGVKQEKGSLSRSAPSVDTHTTEAH